MGFPGATLGQEVDKNWAVNMYEAFGVSEPAGGWIWMLQAAPQMRPDADQMRRNALDVYVLQIV